MAINFPNSPITGEYFVTGNLTYQYTGTVWVSVNTKTNNAYNQANTAFSSAVLKTGNTMTGNLVMSGANITFATVSNSGIYWGSNSFIYSPAANTLVFGTSFVEDVRIDASGNVGIATTSPVAKLDVSGSFSDAKANNLSQTLTDAATISWDASLGRVATITLGGSRTIAAPTNLRVGTYILHVIQGGTGSYTITWNSVFKWTAAVPPTLSTAVGRRDVFSFVSDGTNLYGAMIPDVR